MGMSKKEFADASLKKKFAGMRWAKKHWAIAAKKNQHWQGAMDEAALAELAEREALRSALAKGGDLADLEKRLRELPDRFVSTTALKAIALSSMGLEDPPKILGLIEEGSMRDCQRMANELRHLRGAKRPFWEGAPFVGQIAAALNDRLEAACPAIKEGRN